MFLAYANFRNFNLFQMNIISAFLSDFINHGVYVEQHPGFEYEEFPNYVFKLSKASYDLKQPPRNWHESLSSFFFTKIGLCGGHFIYKMFLGIMTIEKEMPNLGEAISKKIFPTLKIIPQFYF